jgi:ubiquinone/menaquinone biosynthesis C-methylase UbiE
VKNYLIRHFDPAGLADVYDELPLWSAPFGLKLLEHVDYKPGITALDIGFGTGFPLTELAMRLGESSVVYGIDPWTGATARVTKKIEYYGISNIRLIQGTAEAIPLENDSVDLIVSNNGLNNVGDQEKALSECSRIIKDGGQFVMTMNLDKTFIEFYDQLELVLAEMKLETEIGLMHSHIHEKRRPLDEVTSMLQKYGFTVKRIEHDQFCYKFTDGTAMLNHYFIRLAFMESWIKFLPEDRLKIIFDKTEQRLNELARIAGGIQLSVPFVLIDSHYTPSTP